RLVAQRAETALEVRAPGVAGLAAVPARGHAGAVEAPVALVVAAAIRVDVAQVEVQRQVRPEHATGTEDGVPVVLQGAVLVKERVANGSVQVPAVVVLLPDGRLGNAHRSEQGTAQEFLLHRQLLGWHAGYGLVPGNKWLHAVGASAEHTPGKMKIY